MASGLFGRRDRALLTLAAQTTIPYQQMTRLIVARLHIADGTATITDSYGTEHVVEAAADPVLCGPCTLVRWRRILDAEVRHKSVKKLLKDAEVVTAASHHACRSPKPIDDKTLDAALFPPINQYGGSYRYRSGRSARTRHHGWPGRPRPAWPTTKR